MLNKKQNKVLLALMVAFSSSAAFAADESISEDDYQIVKEEVNDQKTDSYFYVGGRLGWSHVNDSCEDQFDCDEDVFGYGLFTGYQFNPFFALEFSANNYGSPEIQRGQLINDEKDLWGAELAGKMTFLDTNSADLYVKIGAAYQYLDPLMADEDQTRDRWGMMAAIGVEFDLSPRWGLRLEAQHTDFFDDDEDIYEDGDAQFFSVGLSYRFGQETVRTVYKEKEVVVVKEAPPVKVITKTLRLSETGDQITAFDFDSAEIPNVEKLDETIPALRNALGEIIVTGHTDSSGGRTYNQNLSLKRAENVADYLVENGIDRNIITVLGKGEREPIASNDSQKGRDLNRRVEIEYKVEDAQYE